MSQSFERWLIRRTHEPIFSTFEIGVDGMIVHPACAISDASGEFVETDLTPDTMADWHSGWSSTMHYTADHDLDPYLRCSLGRFTSPNWTPLPTQSLYSATGKRLRSSSSDSESESGSEIRPRPKRREATLQEPEPCEKPFACPFFKREPLDPAHTWCSTRSWISTARLKEHLYRKHRLLETEVLQLKSRKGLSGKSEEERWLEIYKILFPRDSIKSAPKPYFESSIALNGQSIKDYDTYLKRQLSSAIAQALEGVIPFDETPPILSAVESSLLQLSRSFLSSASVSPSQEPLGVTPHSKAVPSLSISKCPVEDVGRTVLPPQMPLGMPPHSKAVPSLSISECFVEDVGSTVSPWAPREKSAISLAADEIQAASVLTRLPTSSNFDSPSNKLS